MQVLRVSPSKLGVLRSRTTAVVSLVLLAAGAALAGDPAPSPVSIAVSLPATAKDDKGAETARKDQTIQYGVASTLATWGFEVQSRTPTRWDKSLAKAKVAVPAPVKEGETPAAPAPTALVLEGTVSMVYNAVKFYDRDTGLINYVTKADVKIKQGDKEIATVSWQDYFGMNNDAGHEKVLAACEMRATRFLVRDILHTKEIAALVPAAKQEELKKFLASEDEYHKTNFDDFTTHKAPNDEKK